MRDRLGLAGEVVYVTVLTEVVNSTEKLGDGDLQSILDKIVYHAEVLSLTPRVLPIIVVHVVGRGHFHVRVVELDVGLIVRLVDDGVLLDGVRRYGLTGVDHLVHAVLVVALLTENAIL